MNTAVRYLTIVPLPGPASGDRTALGRSAPWFPVVGLLVGLTVAGTSWVTARVFPSLLGALLCVTVWKVLTGGLHLDGLADCLDGLGGHDAEQRLRIMRDSRIGALGAVGLILFLLLEISAVAEIQPWARWRALVLAPVVGRAVAPLLAQVFPPARPDGHAALFRQGLRRHAAPVALGLAAIVAVVVLGVPGLLACVASILAALGAARFVARRIGGISGDVLGAAVELAELVTLLVVAAWAPGAR